MFTGKLKNHVHTGVIMIDVIKRIGSGALCSCTQCKAEYHVKYFADAKKTAAGDLCNTCKRMYRDVKEVNQDVLQKLYNYDPLTGRVTYKFRSQYTNVGDRAETLHSGGYYVIKIAGKQHLAHRLIYLYMTGTSLNMLDHVNHVRTDNRWENLRAANATVNQRNTSVSKNSTTKILGVSRHRKGYRAYIWVDGRQKHLGCYASLEEAKSVREAANVKYGYHRNHGK